MLESRGLLRQALRNARRQAMPSSESIVKQTFQELGYTDENLTPDQVRRDFNHLLREVFEKTLVVLERYEGPVYAESAIAALIELRNDDVKYARQMMQGSGNTEAAFQASVLWLLKNWYPLLRDLFLSVSQSRKTRGGKDFELQLEMLFRLMGVPFERHHERYRADFMLPSYQTYERNRAKALIVIVSVKRTLRERWQEVADELYNLRSPNVYLLTADESISTEKQQALAQRNIYLVVWDEVKQASFPDEPNVISFTSFANEVLPRFFLFWGHKRST